MNLGSIIDGHDDDRVAVLSRGRPSTYGVLRRQVGGLRAGLTELVLCPGDRVAIIASNNRYFVVGYLAVVGAGSIGCFVGGMLAASGYRVALLARPRLIQEIAGNGLRVSSFDGSERRVAADRLILSDDPSILRDARTVLVTVKSADTGEIAGVGGSGSAKAAVTDVQKIAKTLWVHRVNVESGEFVETGHTGSLRLLRRV